MKSIVLNKLLSMNKNTLTFTLPIQFVCIIMSLMFCFPYALQIYKNWFEKLVLLAVFVLHKVI